MQVDYTGHGLEVTPALRDLTKRKLDKLSRHSNNIHRINVTFDIQKLDQVVEAIIHTAENGNEIHAKAKAESMYAAVDSLVTKLDRQLIKQKEKRTQHSHPSKPVDLLSEQSQEEDD